MSTTISTISRAAPVGVDYDADMSNLTPEDVLCYCQTRLSKLQEDISKQAEKQRKMNRASEVLTDLSRKLGELGEGKVSGIAVNRVRTAFDNAANELDELGPDMAKFAQKVRDGLDSFDTNFNRTIEFNDGAKYRLAPGEKDSDAQERHDGWLRYQEIVSSGKTPEKFGMTKEDVERLRILNSKWEGSIEDDRDSGAHPQDGGTLSNVTFLDNNIAPTIMQNLSGNVKNLQGILNENSQTGLDDLRNLTQQREQALQLTQTMLQALQEQKRIAEQWR